MKPQRSYEGSCHCGALVVHYHTDRAPEEWPVRMCTCSFCRRHAPRYTSDPLGSITLQVTRTSTMQRYTFGSKTAEFVLCGQCGTFLCAVSQTQEGARAVVNINTLPSLPTPPGVTMDFDDEPVAQKLERRRRFWSPFSQE